MRAHLHCRARAVWEMPSHGSNTLHLNLNWSYLTTTFTNLGLKPKTCSTLPHNSCQCCPWKEKPPNSIRKIPSHLTLMWVSVGIKTQGLAVVPDHHLLCLGPILQPPCAAPYPPSPELGRGESGEDAQGLRKACADLFQALCLNQCTLKGAEQRDGSAQGSSTSPCHPVSCTVVCPHTSLAAGEPGTGRAQHP